MWDGPLCLGLSSEVADLTLPWAVLVDATGQLVVDCRGRPRVVEPSGRTVQGLEPINAQWLVADVKNPARKRVLFQTKKTKTFEPESVR